MTMDPKDMEGLQPRLREVLENMESEAGAGVAWDDITNKPTEFPPEAHTHIAADITDLGELATKDDVTWGDITNKPTEFPPEAHTHPTSDVTGLGALATEDNVTWDDVANKPATFTPATHTHNASDINAGTLSADRIPTLAQSKITNLSTDLASKLTASQAAAQADSTAEDLETLVSDFNELLAKLRSAGIMEE